MKSSKNNNSYVLKWIFRRTKKQLPSVGIIAALSAVVSLSGIYLALVSKEILDIATGSIQGNIVKSGIILLATVVLQIAINSFDVVFKVYVTGKLTISFRNYLFGLVSSKKYSKISSYHSGDLLNRFTSDADVVINSVVSIIPQICSMFTKIVGGLAALLTLDPTITVIFAVCGICVPAIGRVINKKFKAMHKECQKSEGETRSFLQECFENSVIIKTFESTVPFTKRLNQFLDKNFRLKIKRSKISVFTHMSLFTFFTLGYYAVLIWGAGNISVGAITYGTLTAFLQLFNQLRTPLQNVSGIMPQYYSAIASAERLIEVEEGEEDLPPMEREKLEEIKQSFKSINVHNVDFAYNDEIVLSNCSFSAHRGKITAITGESGSGKSTVFKLLLGLYEPQAGEITLDGEIPLNTSHRGLFAYVPQGNLLLSGTIRENITLCDDTVTEDELIRVTKAAEIYDLIETMPEGFNTRLAERGMGLSEGQIQRISLARALLTDAPVLLLDEATSALDEATETKVLSNIKAFSEKTIIFVTHRNTSLKVCDKIIHVDSDKVFNVVKDG